MTEKSVEIILLQGDIDGVFKLTESKWNAGLLYSCSRKKANVLLSMPIQEYGIYLLLSESQVYVGQTSNLKKRTDDHLRDMDWWTRIIILTKTDDSLDKADIDYLEAELIKKAGNRIFTKENQRKGNPQKVKESARIKLNDYLAEVYVILRLLGINIFSDEIIPYTTESTLFDYVKETKPVPVETVGTDQCNVIADKKVAKKFFEMNGLPYSKFTYAKLSDSTHAYWANPKASVLNDDAVLVLNDTSSRKLTVIVMPKGILSTSGNGPNVLRTRHDRPDVLDINISGDTLKDRVSGVDFNRFVVKKFSYR